MTVFYTSFIIIFIDIELNFAQVSLHAEIDIVDEVKQGTIVRLIAGILTVVKIYATAVRQIIQQPDEAIHP